MGHATNIIPGISVGLESTGLPIIVISFGVISSFYLGEASGITNSKGE
jgi:Na+/H+-translocating membrane pyrophosphatase